MLVTGAGRGIGRSIALVAAEHGANLALGSRRVGESEEVAAACRAQGVDAQAWPLDIADRESVETFVGQCVAHYRRVDTLVNNAGINTPKKILDYEPAEIEELIGVNLTGTLWVTLAAGRHMIETGTQGSVISITSQAGLVGAPLRAPYAAAKGGVHQLTRTLAGEWAEHQITVNAVAPTFTRTPLLESAMSSPGFAANLEKVPLGRIAEPEEIASAVIYLASDAARMVTGQVLAVDGGYSTVR